MLQQFEEFEREKDHGNRKTTRYSKVLYLDVVDRFACILPERPDKSCMQTLVVRAGRRSEGISGRDSSIVACQKAILALGGATTHE